MVLHDGRLEISSEPDIGTVVTMRFPAARLHEGIALEEKLSFELEEDGISTRACARESNLTARSYFVARSSWSS